MLSNLDGNIVKTVWHKDFFNVCKNRLSEDEYQTMINELNKIIEKSVETKSDVIVSSFIPGKDWSNTIWDPIYSKACIFHEEHSAQFFGLLVCNVLIDRKEKWYFLKQDIARGMIYFKEKNKEKIKEDDLKSSINDLKNRFN